MSTVMSAAFRRAGLDPEEAAFNVAIARFQNNGGSATGFVAGVAADLIGDARKWANEALSADE